jgi:hypothetical protein
MRATENNIGPPLRKRHGHTQQRRSGLASRFGGTVQGSHLVDRNWGPLADEHFANGVDYWRTWPGMGGGWRLERVWTVAYQLFHVTVTEYRHISSYF